MRFFIDQAVLRTAIQFGIDSQRQDMLVVRGKNTIIYDSPPRNGYARVDGLRGQDTSGSDFVTHLSSLIKYESEDVFVIGDSNN
jgi:hypothetical protein